MKIITKLNVLLVSVAGLLVAGYLYRISPEQFANGNCWNVLMECTKFKWVFALSILLPIFIFSLVTIKVKEKIFKAWALFSIIFGAIYMYSGVSDNRARDGFSVGLILETIISYSFYIVISTLIISVQYFRHRNKK